MKNYIAPELEIYKFHTDKVLAASIEPETDESGFRPGKDSDSGTSISVFGK